MTTYVYNFIKLLCIAWFLGWGLLIIMFERAEISNIKANLIWKYVAYWRINFLLTYPPATAPTLPRLN